MLKPVTVLGSYWDSHESIAHQRRTKRAESDYPFLRTCIQHLKYMQKSSHDALPHLRTAMFTTEETILLRCLATNSSLEDIARQLRLCRGLLLRQLGELRRKAGVGDDVALAAWARTRISQDKGQ